MMNIDPKIYTIKRENISDVKGFVASAKCEIGGYADMLISSSDFSVQNNSELLSFRLASFDKDLMVADILEEIQKAGLWLPDAQDAVWFAAQHPDLQMQNPIAFLHKPWIYPVTGGENVLILRSYSGNRYLHMHLFDSRWYSHVKFAVIETLHSIEPANLR